MLQSAADDATKGIRRWYKLPPNRRHCYNRSPALVQTVAGPPALLQLAAGDATKGPPELVQTAVGLPAMLQTAAVLLCKLATTSGHCCEPPPSLLQFVAVVDAVQVGSLADVRGAAVAARGLGLAGLASLDGAVTAHGGAPLLPGWLMRTGG
jgi:hypothetical protein